MIPEEVRKRHKQRPTRTLTPPTRVQMMRRTIYDKLVVLEIHAVAQPRRNHPLLFHLPLPVHYIRSPFLLNL